MTAKLAALGKGQRYSRMCRHCGAPGVTSSQLQIRSSKPVKVWATKTATLCEDCAVEAWETFRAFVDVEA